MANKTSKIGDQTRAIPALALRASVQPKSVDVEARTAELVWTTGSRVMRGFYDRFWEELSLDPKHVRMKRLNNGAPLLADHDGSRVASTIGVIVSAQIEGKRGTAVVRFAQAEVNPEADKIFRMIQDGIIQNVSVGYRIHKMEKVEETADKIPVFRATDWEPHEISVVAMGADDGAGFRSADTDTNPCIFTRGEPQQERTQMTPEEIAAAEAARVAELKAAADAAAKAERERAVGIRLAVRALGAAGPAKADKFIADSTPLADVRTAVLDELATRSEEIRTEQHVRVEITDDAQDKFKRGAEAWIMDKSGALALIQRAEKLTSYMDKLARRGLGKTEVGAGQFRGASMGDLARLFLESRGVRVTTHDRVELFRQAYNYRSGYATTSDFAVLFESVLYKSLLAAYETQEDVWTRFCGTKEVQDFRPSNFFRTGSFGVLPPLNEHGEFENVGIPDGLKSVVSVGTYGDIIAISRQAVINDDMGALVDLAAQRGRDARQTIESKVFEQLALNSALGPTVGGVIFFSTTNANINATAAANTATSWDLDAQKMGNQTDISGNHVLNLLPKVLLLPRAKRMEAEVLNTSVVKVGGTNGEPNPAAGMASEIVSTTRLTGTRRYWFADPAKNPAIVVAFLSGQGSAPALSSEEGFRVDGTQFKTRLDFGVSFFDPKCAVTNAGA